MYIYIYIYININIYIYIYIYIYMHTHAHTCIYTYMDIGIHDILMKPTFAMYFLQMRHGQLSSFHNLIF